ncbi:hypothetical protein ACFPM0_20830 [Pseudonocardia sulfidoxydans]|uniref:hypothetical protein n=1 Tax=Pseudonocardia sulfidoxydans TaxID=54011 RepID=UPI00360DD315
MADRRRRDGRADLIPSGAAPAHGRRLASAGAPPRARLREHASESTPPRARLRRRASEGTPAALVSGNSRYSDYCRSQCL